MKLRNFLSWLASSVIAFIIMLLLINIVTSLFVDISMDHTLPIILGSVYDYASPAAQMQASESFTSLCQNIVDVSSQSQNRTECLPASKEALALICTKIETLPLQQQQQAKISCQALNDGTLEASCNPKTDGQLKILARGCVNLNANKTDTRYFLTTSVGGVLVDSINETLNSAQNPDALLNISKSQHINPSLIKYAINYVQGRDKEQYLAVKIVAIILLFILWFVVSLDLSDYLRSVSRMFFSTGMLIFAAWGISFIMVVFYPPDTTSLLGLVSGEANATQPPLSQLIALLPVIVLQLISDYVLLIGAASICVAFLLYLARRYYVDSHPVILPGQAPK